MVILLLFFKNIICAQIPSGKLYQAFLSIFFEKVDNLANLQ